MNYVFCTRPPRQQQSDPESESLDITKNRKNIPTEKCLSVDSITSLNPSKRINPLLEINDRLGSSSSLEQHAKAQAGKCIRVVKNLNEFLNFTSLNKSRIMPSDESELTARLSNEEGVVQTIQDESNSPDDLTDFFPMTTSMTRELRLELESLDRQVKYLLCAQYISGNKIKRLKFRDIKFID